MSTKRIKYNKYKHRKLPWMSNGILKSIKFHDKLYKDMKCHALNTPKHGQFKRNLSTYNKYLKLALS